MKTFEKTVHEKRSRMQIDAGIFSRRGWLMGTCGNLSVRLESEPLKVLMTASGVDKAELTEEDFLLVGKGGALLESSRHKPSSEGGVHEVVYGRTSASACYHVHSIWNNLASRIFRERGRVLFEGIEMIKGLTGESGQPFGLFDAVQLPIVDNHEDMAQLARNVDGGLDPAVPAVLVYQHGVYAWGRDQSEARRHVEILEFLLEYVCRLRQIGP
jgi:methylthioribulose-1-phosphate dehydratase